MSKLVLAASAAAVVTASAAFAQQAPAQAPASLRPDPMAPANAQPASSLPDPYKLNMMIRSAIIALNQANQTGNYTVLRDLGAAAFRATNDAARLAEIFADLRRRQLDLSPILFFTPKILQQPQIDQRGILRLVGYFPTAPEVVKFDLYYLQESGSWSLFGIGVQTAPAEATAALPVQAPGQQPKSQAAAQPAPAKPQPATKPAPPPKEAPKAAEGSALARPHTPKPQPKPEPRARPGAEQPAAQAKGRPAAQSWTTNTTRSHTGDRPASAVVDLAPDSQPQSGAEAPASEGNDKRGLFPFW